MRILFLAVLVAGLALATPQLLRGRQFPRRNRPTARIAPSGAAAVVEPESANEIAPAPTPVRRERPARPSSRAGGQTVRASAAQSVPKSKPKPKRNLQKCGEKGCPTGFEPFNGKCYKVQKFDIPVTIEQAQRRCQTDSSTLASDNSISVHRFLTNLVKTHLVPEVDSKYRRAFVGLMCRSECDSPANWVYADGSSCKDNSFCDWQKIGSVNEWNSVPTALYGATLAAILDHTPDTNYNHKLQTYPADHTLQFAICQREADSTDHLKPVNLAVKERVSNVVLTWDRPECAGEIANYIFVLLGGTGSFDTEVKCQKDACSYELDPETCNHCILPNTDYTFSVAAVLLNAQLGPAVTVRKQIDVETCPNFETPFHTVSTCRGVSELKQDGSCDFIVTWSKGSMCDAVCEVGFGFYQEPSPKYSCDQGGLWSPIGKAPECYEIVPVFSANLQFKIDYKRPSIESLQHQFDGLVYKYNDIFCPYPEECGIGDLQIKSALDTTGNKMSEVIITIDTPVYNITDQAGFIGLVREAVNTVNEDNAFMTLIDYDNIELVLPQFSAGKFKTTPQLCCHTCPEGHAYKLGNCVRCPTADCL